jgi:hypothetical protein
MPMLACLAGGRYNLLPLNNKKVYLREIPGPNLQRSVRICMGKTNGIPAKVRLRVTLGDAWWRSHWLRLHAGRNFEPLNAVAAEQTTEGAHL